MDDCGDNSDESSTDGPLCCMYSFLGFPFFIFVWNTLWNYSETTFKAFSIPVLKAKCILEGFFFDYFVETDQGFPKGIGKIFLGKYSFAQVNIFVFIW